MTTTGGLATPVGLRRMPAKRLALIGNLDALAGRTEMRQRQRGGIRSAFLCAAFICAGSCTNRN